MKIAIYGVPASGKDYLIGQLVDYLGTQGCPMEHVRGSKTLNDMARRLRGKSFSELTEADKAALRSDFPSSLTARERESSNVVVDGHFAFMDERGGITEVFTDADLAAYDAFFYLDTSAQEIANRMESERGEHVSQESVARLKEYEITGLTYRLLDAGKELHVVRNDGVPTLRYIHEVMQGRHSSQRAARELVEQVGSLEGHGVVALVDCDKTLVMEDTTSMLLRISSADESELKNIYSLDRYTSYQDYSARIWLNRNAREDEAAIDEVADAVTPNTGLLDDLKQARGIPILAITAGNARIWSKIISKLGLDATLLCSGDCMSKYVKYHVVKELQALGKFVVAFGDSMMDGLMLEQANRAYVVANKGYRGNVAGLLRECPFIRQLQYSNYQYERVRSDASACWVRSVDDMDEQSMNDTVICKSTSGFHGRTLRLAHYRLGMKVGKTIAEDNPDASFVTVIMMRSGLPFGQGIADHLDCPELFFSGDTASIKEELSREEFRDKTLILIDGVINTGNSMRRLLKAVDGQNTIVAANVISSRCSLDSSLPIYAARVSDNSYMGARQWNQAEGRGPDTSDRLFETI